MEDIKCRKLIATFQEKKVFLGGPKCLRINIDGNITVVIEQLGNRIITISSEQAISYISLYDIFMKIEKLLMLFNGRFVELINLWFEDADNGSNEPLKACADDLMSNRLSYYKSADFCRFSADELIDFKSVITAELYRKWEELLEELDIVHQMYLYSISDIKMPADVKCAFLIELAEPLVEIVKTYTNQFISLTPGGRGTSLKNCVDVLISKYGKVIFSKEMEAGYENFLKIVVESRVRIMHIKRHQQKKYLDGPESILYAQKLALLYRVIIFDVMGIKEDLYSVNLHKSINKLNEWNNVLEMFLTKID